MTGTSAPLLLMEKLRLGKFMAPKDGEAWSIDLVSSDLLRMGPWTGRLTESGLLLLKMGQWPSLSGQTTWGDIVT